MKRKKKQLYSTVFSVILISLSFLLLLAIVSACLFNKTVQCLTCCGDTCPHNKFTILLAVTAHLAHSMFWHSVIVTLSAVFSAAHQGGETHSLSCQ